MTRQSTLEAIHATEKELEQRILKKQQEVKELSEILSAPPEENLDSRRGIYQIIETKTAELSKAFSEGEKIKMNYSRGLISLDKLKHTTNQLLQLLGFQPEMANNLVKALEIVKNQSIVDTKRDNW